MAGVTRGCGTSLDLLRSLPRVSLANLKPNPGSRKRERRPRDRRRGRKCGRGHKGERQRGTRPRLGFEGGQTPFYIRIPKYGFNEGHSFRHQYQPLSLRRLQYLIDLGRVDPTQPIDLTQLVNGRGVTIQPLKRDYGVQLVEEGADTFQAKVNIEVQLASELAIAAIEKNGGVVTTAFYDPRSLEILCKPVPFFLRGQPIPKRMLPPEALVPYYTDAKNRGYLADPAKFPEARLELAMKYGYVLPDITKDELFRMLSARKDPRQIFFGLGPGWVKQDAKRDATVLNGCCASKGFPSSEVTDLWLEQDRKVVGLYFIFPGICTLSLGPNDMSCGKSMLTVSVYGDSLVFSLMEYL
ncbi:hypothetical protein STEG23_029862, partial [Scotinomys teguina]